MMLPEHREKLKEHHQKIVFREKFPMPLLDEQQWEEFQYLVNQSIHIGIELKITILTPQGYLDIIGVVSKINPISNQLVIATGEGIIKIAASQVRKILKAHG